MKRPTLIDLYNFTNDKLFKEFEGKVKIGSTTAEISFEVTRAISMNEFAPSVRFYEDGSISYVDCTEQDQELLEKVIKKFKEYKKTFRGRFSKFIG